MLYSMTGYGQKRMRVADYDLIAEVRTLNSRNLDIRVKLPANFRELEMEIRSIIKERCIRGKVEFVLTMDGDNVDENFTINRSVLSQYHKELQELAKQENIEFLNPINTLLRLPNAYLADRFEMNDAAKSGMDTMVRACLDELDSFRENEGAAMEKDIRENVRIIEEFREKCQDQESDRHVRLRQKFKKNLELLDLEVDIDNNRLEQELIYYLERMDFTEETNRLRQHCQYFTDILDNTEICKGRKLNFISQEMGREINTLGSKANDAEIQRSVVNMKDELEKIKEQTANIL